MLNPESEMWLHVIYAAESWRAYTINTNKRWYYVDDGTYYIGGI